MALYLSEADVRHLLTPKIAVDVVEEAFRQWGAGQADNVPRVRAQAPGIVLHSMCATSAALGKVGWKCYTTTKSGARFLVGLNDAATGELLALIEADRLGQLRTGAATAVAVEWCGAPELTELGLFGAGHQAQTQLEAVAVVRALRRVFVYSRDAARRAAFADEMSERLECDVVPVDRPSEAAEELPLVITATTSRAPVFDGQSLAEGTLVCAVGSNWLNKAEIDTAVIRRADNIVCDQVEACRREAGDFSEALARGMFDWSRAVNLADVVAGRAVGRNDAQSVVLFKSVGLALEDIALATRLLDLARAAGRGVPLPL